MKATEGHCPLGPLYLLGQSASPALEDVKGPCFNTDWPLISKNMVQCFISSAALLQSIHLPFSDGKILLCMVKSYKEKDAINNRKLVLKIGYLHMCW